MVLKGKGQLYGILGGLAFFVIFLVLMIQFQQILQPNPILRKRLEMKEAFQSPPKVADSQAKLKPGTSPSAASLDAPRQPYTILNGWLSPKSREEAAASYQLPGAPDTIPDSRYGTVIENLYKEVDIKPRNAYTAQTCYESDFETRLERTGNYRQLTNNYKRGDPDSCTAPLQDVALGYYKVDPVEPGGCLSRKEWPLTTLRSNL
jgi:hypothetical protein